MKTKTSRKKQIMDEVEILEVMRTLNYSTVIRGNLKTRQRSKHNQHLSKVNFVLCLVSIIAACNVFCNSGNFHCDLKIFVVE